MRNVYNWLYQTKGGKKMKKFLEEFKEFFSMVKALNKAAEKIPPLDLNKKTCEDINERLHGPYDHLSKAGQYG